MLNRKLISTDDGSVTIYIPEWNESYHSKHGAVREAVHVFIKNGLEKIDLGNKISILEIGFGTGLNCLITFLKSLSKQTQVNYTGLEKYPVSSEEYLRLNYAQIMQNENLVSQISSKESEKNYLKIMDSDWEDFQLISQNFNLKKVQTDFFEFDYPKETFDLVYFDAFGARVQPELWENELFEKVSSSMKKNGLLTTYSSKGSVRRNLKELGFEVEKLAGPPGKREMINAIKK